MKVCTYIYYIEVRQYIITRTRVSIAAPQKVFTTNVNKLDHVPKLCVFIGFNSWYRFNYCNVCLGSVFKGFEKWDLQFDVCSHCLKVERCYLNFQYLLNSTDRYILSTLWARLYRLLASHIHPKERTTA